MIIPNINTLFHSAVPFSGVAGGKNNVKSAIKMVRVVHKMLFKNEIMIAHFDFSAALAQLNINQNIIIKEYF